MSAMLKISKTIFNPEVNNVSDVLTTNSEALSHLYAQVTRTCYLTEDDRQLIKSVLLQEHLQEEECRIINRILYSVRRGWIKLVRDLHHSQVSGGVRRSLQVLESVA
jgi:hypothetical protein